MKCIFAARGPNNCKPPFKAVGATLQHSNMARSSAGLECSCWDYYHSAVSGANKCARFFTGAAASAELGLSGAPPCQAAAALDVPQCLSVKVS